MNTTTATQTITLKKSSGGAELAHKLEAEGYSAIAA